MAAQLHGLAALAVLVTSAILASTVWGSVSEQESDCCWCTAWRRSDKTIQLSTETSQGSGNYSLNQAGLDEFVGVLNSADVKDKEIVVIGVVGELKWGKALNMFYRFLACVEADSAHGIDTSSQDNIRWQDHDDRDFGPEVQAAFSTDRKAVSILRQPFAVKSQGKTYAVFLLDVTGLTESRLTNASVSQAVYLANFLSSTLMLHCAILMYPGPDGFFRVIDAPRSIPVQLAQTAVNQAVKLAADASTADRSLQTDIIFLLRDHVDRKKLGWQEVSWLNVSQSLGLGSQSSASGPDRSVNKSVHYFMFPTGEGAIHQAAPTDWDFMTATRNFFARLVLTNPSLKKVNGNAATGGVLAQHIKSHLQVPAS